MSVYCTIASDVKSAFANTCYEYEEPKKFGLFCVVQTAVGRDLQNYSFTCKCLRNGWSVRKVIEPGLSAS